MARAKTLTHTQAGKRGAPTHVHTSPLLSYIHTHTVYDFHKCMCCCMIVLCTHTYYVCYFRCTALAQTYHHDSTTAAAAVVSSSSWFIFVVFLFAFCFSGYFSFFRFVLLAPLRVLNCCVQLLLTRQPLAHSLRCLLQ